MSTTAPPLNSNPPCPNCQGNSQKRGTRNGYTRFLCNCCRCRFRQLADGTVVAPRQRDLRSNPRCPTCQAVARKVGFLRNGTRLYRCFNCRKGFVFESQRQRQIQSNPHCPACGATSQKRGLEYGKYLYRCRECNKGFSLTPQQQRQHRARLQMEQLPALIEQKLPKNLPLEIREELQQELVMAALAGEFDLSELDQAITTYRRKVNRESLTGFGYVSLDAVIPQTNGLTYADTLAG
jgi:transposase-like protein